ncbi:hypothetical protein GCM10023091_33790 [Ravibacter arvi]|uniref:Uncharacterized protein n=1 Tax=Ravibacter arvi TaxID=2051041 RepID=A0ABP8M760_9BACT
MFDIKRKFMPLFNAIGFFNGEVCTTALEGRSARLSHHLSQLGKSRTKSLDLRGFPVDYVA